MECVNAYMKKKMKLTKKLKQEKTRMMEEIAELKKKVEQLSSIKAKEIIEEANKTKIKDAKLKVKLNEFSSAELERNYLNRNLDVSRYSSKCYQWNVERYMHVCADMYHKIVKNDSVKCVEEATKKLYKVLVDNMNAVPCIILDDINDQTSISMSNNMARAGLCEMLYFIRKLNKKRFMVVGEHYVPCNTSISSSSG